MGSELLSTADLDVLGQAVSALTAEDYLAIAERLAELRDKLHAHTATSVSVPEAKYPDEGNGDSDSYNAGWNACRAATLSAGAQSSGPGGFEVVNADGQPLVSGDDKAQLDECAAFCNSHHSNGPYTVRAAPSPPAAQQPKCATCNDVGLVGGIVGQTPENYEEISEPCPDCSAPAALDAQPVAWMHSYPSGAVIFSTQKVEGLSPEATTVALYTAPPAPAKVEVGDALREAAIELTRCASEEVRMCNGRGRTVSAESFDSLLAALNGNGETA